METKRAPALQLQMTAQLFADVTVDPFDVSAVTPCLHEAHALGRPPHLRSFRDGWRHLFWSMWLFLGVQIVFSSFFLSMLGPKFERGRPDFSEAHAADK